MWALFLEQWNGISFFLESQDTNAEDLQFFTDATPTGFGGFYQGKWFSGRFEDNMIPDNTKASMALFELYPIVMATVLWGHSGGRKKIIVNCDNAATVDIINKGRSKVPFIMKFVRKLIWLEAKHNFLIRAKFIPEKTNCISDALSRFNLQKFQRLAPQADQTPTPCLLASELMLF